MTMTYRSAYATRAEAEAAAQLLSQRGVESAVWFSRGNYADPAHGVQVPDRWIVGRWWQALNEQPPGGSILVHRYRAT